MTPPATTLRSEDATRRVHHELAEYSKRKMNKRGDSLYPVGSHQSVVA